MNGLDDFHYFYFEEEFDEEIGVVMVCHCEFNIDSDIIITTAGQRFLRSNKAKDLEKILDRFGQL